MTGGAKAKMIELKNLSKTFLKDGNRIEVLRGLNLKIARGESLAIVGVSGAGKSTLIHILGTLDHPTDGALYINDLNIFEWDEKTMARFPIVALRKRAIVFSSHSKIFKSLIYKAPSVG